MDYRYFPDPDLPPLRLTAQYIEERAINELPVDRRLRYASEWKLPEDDARILSSDKLTSDFYEELVAISGDPKKSCSYITTILFAIFEAHHEKVDLSDVKGGAAEVGKVIQMVNADELSSTNSKLVIEKLVFE